MEICENNVGADGKLDAATYRNAVLLTADICHRHGWPANATTIRTHRSWINRGSCPRLLQGADWDKFIADVAAELARTDGRPQRHQVQRNETYGIIGARYGVAVADLRRWNGWLDTQVPVGAWMWLEDPASAESKSADPKQAEIDQLKGELADRDKTISELRGKIKKAQDALK